MQASIKKSMSPRKHVRKRRKPMLRNSNPEVNSFATTRTSTQSHAGLGTTTRSGPLGGPRSRLPFKTYADYISVLVKRHGCEHLRILADSLSRGMLSADIEDFVHQTEGNGKKHMSETVERVCILRLDRGRCKYSSVYREGSQEDLRENLCELLPDIQQQIVVVELLRGDSSPIPTWVVDALGLGLDIGPDIWLYLLSRTPRSRYHACDANRAWVNRDNFIEVERDILMILEERRPYRHQTAVLFVVGEDGLDNSQTAIFLGSELPSEVGRPRSLWDFLEVDDSGRKRHKRKSSTLLNWIQMHGMEALDTYGADNFLFVCLKVLIEFQLSRTPLNIPSVGVLGFAFRTQYTDYFQKTIEDLATDTYGPPSTQGLWDKLQLDIIKKRETLLAIPDFVANNFNKRSSTFPASQATDPFVNEYEKVRGRYERHVEWLEMYAARLKDVMEIKSAQGGIQLSQSSIKESKRMTLFTFLAFIDLPVSLAATILGMNIKEVNDDDHPLHWAQYIIMAVSLFLGTLVLLGLSAAVTWYRRRRMDPECAWQDKSTLPLLLLDKILFLNVTCRTSGETRRALLALLGINWKSKGQKRFERYEAEHEAELTATRELVKRKGDVSGDLEAQGGGKVGGLI